MNIVVAGCGKVGTMIISSFVEEEHNVVAIEKEPSALNEVTNIYDVMGVCGDSTDCDVLTEARIQNCELFVAVTNSDELNMLSCFIARKMGAKHTIARIRKPEYNIKSLSFLREQLGISMAINPELLAAKEMFDILKLPSAVKIETFSGRRFEIVELLLKDNASICGESLMSIRSKMKAKFLVCVVQRGNEVYIPDGNFVLESGDKIGLTAAPTEIQKFLRAAGIDQKQARSIMLLGGSRIAFYLAKMLETTGTTVKIVERSEKKCDDLSENLPKAFIINGDGAQQEVLVEEGLNSLDAFVSLTGMDEENILISIFAASHNVPTVITKVNRSELAEMAAKLGLDRIISPKKIVSNSLVRYARALENSLGSNVESLYKIMDDKAEVLEFNVRSDFKQMDVPLKDIVFKPNILIGGIIRDRKALIPSGNDVIKENDKVIVVAANQRLNDLCDIIMK